MVRSLSCCTLMGTAALLTGCTFIKSPEFGLVGVEQTERTGDAAVLLFHLEATNDNKRELPLRRARYWLTLDGEEVFRGERTAEATVREFGTQPFDLPVVVRADRFDLSRLDASGALPFELSGKVEYLTPGRLADVLFDQGLHRPKAKISVRGMLEVGPEPAGSDTAGDAGDGEGEPAP